ncbi:hypothetical protein [Streptomyces litmocidini]|uniref:Uncharacterized protein n=1 Tax=Streptomyces litmocidini TaxID=67318 RepID=A0ABW7U5L5_9ACTN
MLTWLVRISSVLAFTGAAALSLWVAGLPAGVPLPAPGLVTMAWVVVGLVWLRVVTLWIWWSDDHYYWMPHTSEARPVSLEKDGATGGNVPASCDDCRRTSTRACPGCTCGSPPSGR